MHDGSPAFTDQILAAVLRQTDIGRRQSKGKSKRKVDAAALVMALDGATTPANEGACDNTHHSMASPLGDVWTHATALWRRVMGR